MPLRCRSFLVIALLCALVAPLSAQRFAGRVLDVTDGDTVIVARGRGQVTVRLFGIDAPEGTQPYGAESAAELSRLVLGKVINVDMKDVDTYGRLVASVSVGDLDVGEALVRAGAAWHYVQYTSSEALGFSPAQVLATAEREARQARRGLWQSASPQPPWTFRAAARPPTLAATAATTRPGQAAFHGNRESRVFHAPGCQHYSCRNCTVPLATVSQATAAGFRAHAQCVR